MRVGLGGFVGWVVEFEILRIDKNAENLIALQ